MKTREITESETERLQELTSCSNEATSKRAEVVLMASEGMDSGAIARSLGTSERTVRHAVKEFNDGGPEALKRRVPPGRPRSVSEEQRESLIAVIRRSPAEFGIHSERWDVADLIVVARNEGVLRDVSYWTFRREIARIIDLDLRDHLNMPDQRQPGAPRGNRNAVKHGAYFNGEPSPEERALIADIEARFLRDFPSSDKDDTQLIRAAAEACLMLNRGLNADCADAAIRADRRFRKAIKALKTKGKRRSDEPKTTPAEWASELLRRYRNS